MGGKEIRRYDQSEAESTCWVSHFRANPARVPPTKSVSVHLPLLRSVLHTTRARSDEAAQSEFLMRTNRRALCQSSCEGGAHLLGLKQAEPNRAVGRGLLGTGGASGSWQLTELGSDLKG